MANLSKLTISWIQRSNDMSNIADVNYGKRFVIASYDLDESQPFRTSLSTVLTANGVSTSVDSIIQMNVQYNSWPKVRNVSGGTNYSVVAISEECVERKGLEQWI